MPRLRHYDHLGTVRAVNFSCYRRLKLLREEREIRVVLQEIDKARARHQFALLGYVVMPSHVHLIIYPPDTIELGSVIGQIKSRSGRRILESWRASNHPVLSQLAIQRAGQQRYAFWQRRCYDHNCRTPEAVREKIEYCHLNPVRAGLVSDPGDWPWSSYRWYNDLGGVVLDVDGIVL